MVGSLRPPAIVGIGATEFSKTSGRSELRLALEAIVSSLDDAGLHPGDVDGLVTFTMDSSDEMEVARCLGVPELRFFSRTHYGGGGGCGTIHHAALAVGTGAAEVVVCYRALNERSGMRLGQFIPRSAAPTTGNVQAGWYSPYGLATPAARVALFARRYMHEYGATSLDFGRVAVAIRARAATNPRAYFYGRPITLEEHQSSRMIADPIRLLDCCQESDGAVAVVVTTLERARSLRRSPVLIAGSAQGSGPNQEMMTSYSRADLTDIPEIGVVARELWRQSGLTPNDIHVAILYDHFTPWVLVQLEELGFCGRGEAAAFVAEGNIELDGRLPINTHGGQIGEAYIHGMNGIAEGVRQVRGDAVNQVRDVQHVLVTSGPGIPTSGLILGKA